MIGGEREWRRGAVSLALTAVVAGSALAEEADKPVAEEDAPAVVVTGTRVEQKSFDLPMAINAIGQQQIQGEGRPMVNISEQLNRVPGTLVQGRETFGQEQQITLRGFGARSQFGVRGIKLLADEIPASTPDGQGGSGLFDLSSAKRIEVLRGPFSALYGNHSGGVVQIFTEDGPQDPTITGSFGAGSWGTWRAGLKFGGTSGGLNYIANGYRFETDGYREHSSARRDLFNAKLSVGISDSTKVTMVFNYLDQPNDEDPLGLSRAQMARDRRSVDLSDTTVNALTYNTRRSLTNTQLGAVLESNLSSSDVIRFLAYVGQRSNEGYLAISGSTQDAIRSAGAVTVFDRDFGGVGARWTHQGQIAAMPTTLTVGADYDIAAEARKGFKSDFGVKGVLKRDEDNTVDSWGLYAQGEMQVTEPLSLSAGIRYTHVNFESEDHFVCTGATGLCAGATTTTFPDNPDDSGTLSFDAVTPVVGALYRVTPALNLYANVGRSFETPTLIELAYRPDGGAGLNFTLKPSKSMHYEVGAKTVLAADTRIDAALFRIDTSDEIVVLSNRGGRATYQNAGDTRRYGIELSVDSNLPADVNALISFTWLKAEYADSFRTCVATPCNPASGLGTSPVNSGNKIPGIPEMTVYGEVSWKYRPWGFGTGVEVRYVDKIYVNDTNSDTADSYFLMNLRAGFEQRLGTLVLREYARVDNLFDEEYVGGVYVNDANSRFFAPAAERSYFVGVSASYAF